MSKAWLPSLVLAAAGIATAQAQNVGLSVNIGAPGFFGRIELGSAPPPELVFAAPVLVERREHWAPPAPIYLHVPPGHERHWSRHCREYDACGVPVFFVRDRWYNDVYVPHYRDRRDDQERREVEERRREEYRDEHRDRGERHDRDERRDRDERHDGDERHDHGERGDRGEHRGHRDDDDRERDPNR